MTDENWSDENSDLSENTNARGNGKRNTTVPLSHGGELCRLFDDDLVDYLENYGNGSAVDSATTIIEKERIRSENPYRYARLMSFAEKESRDRIRLLRLLVEHPTGVTYHDILERIDGEKRWAKRLVKELVDADVVERKGKPASIKFVDETTEILARDVVSLL